jgi:hypothetical protein
MLQPFARLACSTLSQHGTPFYLGLEERSYIATFGEFAFQVLV